MAKYKISALLIAACLLVDLTAKSQKKLTLSAFTGSGISFFRGSWAVSETHYYVSDVSGIPSGIGNIYGKNQLTSFLGGLQAGITFPSKWIILLSCQYEQTGGRLNVDSAFAMGGGSKMDGKYKRYYDFISVNPQVGRILYHNGIIFTVHTGLDYAPALNVGDQFEYTSYTGQKVSLNRHAIDPTVTDLRFTFGATITRKKWSLDVNYKLGFTNYWKYEPGNVYSRILHIRVQYAFLSKNI